jgi:hypothetical protein
MTNLYPVGDITQTAGEGPGEPGAAPNGSQMQGNPQASQYTPSGAHVPAPQTGGAGQTVNTPLSHDGIARGNIPVNAQPTNIGTGAGFGGVGTDSLMAQMSRGQVLLNQSTYGQGGFVPQNGGASPQVQSPAASNTQSQPNGIASTLTVASPTNYVGN